MSANLYSVEYDSTTRVIAQTNLNITASSLLIGTSTDNSASLYISGSGNKNIVEVDRFDGNEVFIIDASGSVIIGNISCSVITASLLRTDTTTGSTAPVTLQGYYQVNVGGVNYWTPYYSSP